jgi:hypothetical protein
MAVRFEAEDRNGKFLLKTFFGKRTKPESWIAYRTDSDRAEAIADTMIADAKSEKADAERKVERAARKAELIAAVEVGSVFHHSWGYDQTQCDFYEVIEKSKSGKTVTVREIGAMSVAGTQGSMSEQRKAMPGVFIEGAKAIKKVLSEYGISMKYGGAAYLVEHPETESFYCSWYA